MVCERCGSSDVITNTSVYSVTKSRSFLWNLLLIFLTGGLWILWMLIRKKKVKSVQETWSTCQRCGYSWKVERK